MKTNKTQASRHSFDRSAVMFDTFDIEPLDFVSLDETYILVDNLKQPNYEMA